jgi:hypothetical protein
MTASSITSVHGSKMFDRARTRARFARPVAAFRACASAFRAAATSSALHSEQTYTIRASSVRFDLE